MDSKVPCPLCGKELKITSIGSHVKNSCPATKEAREKEKREKVLKEAREKDAAQEKVAKRHLELKEVWHTTTEWRERKKFKKEYPVLFAQFKVVMRHTNCGYPGDDDGCKCYVRSDKPCYW